MAKMVKKSFEVVDLGDVEIRRVTHEPGWRWSECVKPTVGTDSCQVGHLIHVLSGRILVRMNDGSEAEFGPGDVGSIPPGHDAWTLGDEPFISIDFGDALYTKQQLSHPDGRACELKTPTPCSGFEDGRIQIVNLGHCIRAAIGSKQK